MSALELIGAEVTMKFAELMATIEQAKVKVARAAEDAAEAAEPYIGKDEAAKFLRMSVSTLEIRMREDDGPPRYTDGGKVNFLRSELKRWRQQYRAGDQSCLRDAPER